STSTRDARATRTSGATSLGAGQLNRCALSIRSPSLGSWREMVIITVALNRLAVSFADDMTQLLGGLFFGGLRASHVEYFFAHDRAVQIVHPITERNLRERHSHAHPISGEVIDVIEVNPAHREIAQLIERARACDVREHRCLRFEGE